MIFIQAEKCGRGDLAVANGKHLSHADSNKDIPPEILERMQRNGIEEFQFAAFASAERRKFSVGIERIDQVRSGDVVSYQDHASDPRGYYRVTSTANNTIRARPVDDNNRETGSVRTIPWRGKTGIGRPRVVLNP